MPCPTCAASDNTPIERGGQVSISSLSNQILNAIIVVSRRCIENLDLTTSEEDIFTELELVAFAVAVHCQR